MYIIFVFVVVRCLILAKGTSVKDVFDFLKESHERLRIVHYSVGQESMEQV